MTSDGRGAPSTPPRGDRAPNIQATRKTGLGAPLDLSDEALDQAAQVTPLDIAAAAALWRQHAPSKLAGLLDAKPETP
jgi:hypothetical protein